MKQHGIDTWANVAVIIACVSITVAVWDRFINARVQQRAPVMYQPNEQLPDSLPTNTIINSGRTLLLVVDSRCSVCTVSIPFYKRVIKVAAPDVRIVLAGVQSPDSLKAYAAREHIEPHAIISVPPGLLKIRSTPLLILVDANRRVLRSWVGQLNAIQEEEVISAIVPRAVPE